MGTDDLGNADRLAGYPVDRWVPVAGGRIAVHELGTGELPVVALHGITSNALTWLPVADALSGTVRLIAPDLRGRADSAGTVSPAGLGAHVDDVIELLDSYGLERATVVGHSMGGYVAALLAARHPDRVAHIVLVDGGVAFPPPAGVDIDAALTATIGPAMQRLSMNFPSSAAYLDFWQPHPALGPSLDGPQGGLIKEYLLHDLVPAAGGGFRSSCAADVVREDGAGVLFGFAEEMTARPAHARWPVPTTLLWAERGMMNQTPGMLTAEAVAAAQLPDSAQVTFIPGVNHYTILFDDTGLAAIVTAVRAALAAG